MEHAGSVQANKAIVMRFFDEYWNHGKLEALDEYISPQRIHHFGMNAETNGLDQMRKMNRLWRNAAPDFQYNAHQLIDEGDMVAALVSFTGTHTGVHHVAGRTVQANGKEFRESEMFVFRIADGKITESWAAWDRLGLLEQLGATVDGRTKPSRSTPAYHSVPD